MHVLLSSDDILTMGCDSFFLEGVQEYLQEIARKRK